MIFNNLFYKPSFFWQANFLGSNIVIVAELQNINFFAKLSNSPPRFWFNFYYFLSPSKSRLIKKWCLLRLRQLKQQFQALSWTNQTDSILFTKTIIITSCIKITSFRYKIKNTVCCINYWYTIKIFLNRIIKYKIAINSIF